MLVQSSPNVVATSSFHNDASSTILPFTQGPTQPSSGGDQPPNKNIPLDKTCQDGLVLVIRTEIKDKKKKVEELKNTAVTVVLSPHSRPIPFVNVTLLLPSSPQIQVVDLGDCASSESD